MKASPIYIIENTVYRFEQVIEDMVELFNSPTQKSVMIDSRLDLETAIENKEYTIIQN
jgi:hypothetical protein